MMYFRMPEKFIRFPCQYTQAAWNQFLHAIDSCDVLNFPIASTLNSKKLSVGYIRTFNSILNIYQKYSLICVKDWNSTLTITFTDHSSSDWYPTNTQKALIKFYFPENNFTQEKFWSVVIYFAINFIAV